MSCSYSVRMVCQKAMGYVRSNVKNILSNHTLSKSLLGVDTHEAEVVEIQIWVVSTTSRSVSIGRSLD